MGLFDKWRRKSDTRTQAVVRGREHMRPAKPLPEREERVKFDEVAPEVQQKLLSLVAEYERLSRRRDELQRERGELTFKLDKGELTAMEFRKQLREKIQEASRLTERMKETSNQLSALGYRGVLN